MFNSSTRSRFGSDAYIITILRTGSRGSHSSAFFLIQCLGFKHSRLGLFLSFLGVAVEELGRGDKKPKSFHSIQRRSGTQVAEGNQRGYIHACIRTVGNEVRLPFHCDLSSLLLLFCYLYFYRKLDHFITIVSLYIFLYIVNDSLMFVLFHMTTIIDIKMNVETIVNMRG